MKKGERIETFIRETFELYDMDYDLFIDLFSEEADRASSSLPAGKSVKLSRVEKAAEVLGFDPKALLDMDEKETAKWLHKFNYFDRLSDFRFARESSFHGEDYEMLRLYDVFFDTHEAQKLSLRYDYRDVVRRMIELLKELDAVLPGTYHPGARITKLHIETENFCHYKEIDKLVLDYLQMIDRVQELFFKAWKTELSVEEAREYNFLVNAIGIEDRECFSDGPLMYSRLKIYVPVYREEGYTDFFAYVRINQSRILNAWTCAELTEHPDLLARLLHVCPCAHRMMREFAMLVSKFHCTFTWSDALPFRFPEEDEFGLYEYENAMNLPHDGAHEVNFATADTRKLLLSGRVRHRLWHRIAHCQQVH